MAIRAIGRNNGSLQRAGIKQRLSKVYLLQIGLITLVALLSVAATTFFLEKVLIKNALKSEAEFFWNKHASDSSFPLPSARHLQGFLNPGSNLPQSHWSELPSGLHSASLGGLEYRLYVSTRGGKRLYLLYSNQQVRKLVALYGLVPLTCVLILLYLSHWLAYRASSRAVSPITRFAEAVNEYDPANTTSAHFNPNELPPNTDFELYTLSQAMHGFARRLERFVERERNFTRDASHELRTPLTVIKAAVDTLAAHNQNKPAQVTLERIRRASTSMEELIDAFLMLARESSEQNGRDNTAIKAIVQQELADVQFLIDDRPVTIKESYHNDVSVSAPSNIVSAFFGNLIRNAVSYTETGEVSVEIENNQVRIHDTGCGIHPDNLDKVFTPFFREGRSTESGSGIGMAIVKRIADRFNWMIEIDSEPDVGTLVTVTLGQQSKA